MGEQYLFLIKTHFVFMSKRMVFFIRVLWVLFFTSLFTLFGFIGRHIFRFQRKSIAVNCTCITQPRQECYTPEFVIEQKEEEQESKSILRFRFPTFEEFVRNNDIHLIRDQLLSDNSDDNWPLVETKIDTLSSNLSTVLKPVEYTVKPRRSSEINMIVNPINEIVEHRINSGNPTEMIVQVIGEIIGPHRSSENASGSFFNFEIEDSRRDLMSVLAYGMEENSKEFETESRGGSNEMVDNLENNVHNLRNRTHYLSDNESLLSDYDSDSVVSSNSSFRSSFIDSLSDELLCDIDFQRAFEIDTLMECGLKEVKLSKEFLTEEDIELQNLSKGYGSDDFIDEDKDILQELKNIEYDIEDETGNVHIEGMESESESNLVDVSNTLNIEDATHMESDLLRENLELNLADNGSKQISKKSSSGEQLSSDSDEQNVLEREWEHQDLVEQLKMEIRNVRAIGLPTILEESESPKIVDDLKPRKIEHKYPHEGTMDELHKFYKSYRERMRKLDILNFQKMYAIGFLRLKDPLQSFTKNKISIPALSAIVSFNCWPCKPKSSSETHKPLMQKFTKELESDLEMIYVGHMCLSWEFLCWEYGKALDLWESDPQGMHCYNEVAGKFQMFQVLLTRFLEDGPVKGPRVQHYVTDRCVLRNLLQVPVIRDDNYRDRKKEGKLVSRKDSITSLQLVEIIEESIRILWQFIRTDKETSNATLEKLRRSSNVELPSSADLSLLEEVRSTLQKKDKKLKELTRRENCIWRNFRKHQQEDGSDNVQHFFARVDMKLVARVLNMSRISTEQLVWCSDILNKIHFIGRNLQVEPSSILLFPCL